MASLSSVMRQLPFSVRSVRRHERSVRSLSKRFGAGLTPLEHVLDDLVGFLDWFEPHLRSARLQGLVALLREAERSDALHAIVLEIESRRTSLARLSTTFAPLQRGRYRPLLKALITFHDRLTAFDDLISWVVRHPQDVSKRLFRSFGFSARFGVVRCSFDPSGAILFGDGMEENIVRIFELGPVRFKRSVRSFLKATIGSIPLESLKAMPRPITVQIMNVSAAHSIAQGKGVTLSINALEFLEAFFADDRAAIYAFFDGPERSADEVVSEDRVLVAIKNYALDALEDVWRKRALSNEYAGVLSVELLELPNHTGSFSTVEEFIAYASTRIPEDFASYLARDIGLHIGWTLFSDRIGHYRPIGTAAIRELAGRRNAHAVLDRILAEMRGSNARTLLKHYVNACVRLTRAPLVERV